MTTFAECQASRKLQEPEIFEALKCVKNIARFESKISHEPMSGCWLWDAATGSYGHGQFFLKWGNGKILMSAHRASWMIHKGELQPTDIVCHKCDNPCCVNPDHLFIGTQRDNMRDASAKGRIVLPNVVGEANSAAILTDCDVAYIRASSKSAKALAQELGVSHTAVWECRVGVTWGHLPGAQARTGMKRRSDGGHSAHVFRAVRG